MLRKTKIVCTLGPSTDDENVMRQLIEAGLNVARFNFSHGPHDEQMGRIKMLRKLRKELNRPVAALLDTKGPEIRLGLFENGEKVLLKEGQTFTLTTEEITGNAERASISYKELPQDVKAGNHILIDDGLVDMEVQSTTDTDIVCKVINAGKIGDRKGVNVPNVDLSMEFISPKDYSDILFGIENDYDYIAASFVRTKDDVLAIRKILKDNNAEHQMKIISKIENMQGVKNIDEIIEVSDGIMVARGDMGVEIPIEEVPVIQKEIIKKTVAAGKIVITATQMLDSMIKNPRPTRAEATDVANAIYDGTSAIMLSGETACGEYPVEAVKTMARIALRTEQDINYLSRLKNNKATSTPDITNAISHATVTLAGDLGASAIVAVTKSGRTCDEISKFRPICPIIGGCLTEKVYRQLNLCWGVVPALLDEKEDLDELFAAATTAAKATGIAKEDDVVIMTAGVPLGVSGTTNLVKAEIVK